MSEKSGSIQEPSLYPCSTFTVYCIQIIAQETWRFRTIIMWSALLALVPLISALQLPHIPTPQSAIQAADAYLHSTADLSYANDMKLASMPGDEHLVFTSARHPVCPPGLLCIVILRIPLAGYSEYMADLSTSRTTRSESSPPKDGATPQSRATLVISIPATARTCSSTSSSRGVNQLWIL